jgi:hypothetical protein
VDAPAAGQLAQQRGLAALSDADDGNTGEEAEQFFDEVECMTIHALHY